MSNRAERPEMNITNTFLSNLQVAASRRNKPYPYFPNTTLNEALGILPDDAPEGTIPHQNYWAIGRDGLVSVQIGDKTTNVPDAHTIEHVGFYEQIPFAARYLENDLPLEEQAKLGLREVREINGKAAAVYWLRRLEQNDEPLRLEQIIKEDGKEDRDIYVPDSKNLNPEKSNLRPDGQNISYSRFITTTDRIVCKLSKSDIAEIVNACEMLYGHAELANISELAIVQGVDKEINAIGKGNTTYRFKEVVGAQIASTCCFSDGLLMGRSSFYFSFDNAVTDAMAIPTVDDLGS
jgi:hypothetical protein